MAVEVKIGVENVQRELVLETETSPEDVQAKLSEALSASSVLTLVDVKGRSIVVPAAKVAYLEIGSGSRGGVGFR
ncbi:MAG: hypothetical protein AVDCRST_MAG36-505 [uncultured Nocardioidaceae bacterium]|uniref:ATP-binding protein n=1 Tax=uncultured Nocardioidaceae bacterium TaxID=253824 RepID=A0A6J4L413_9ACTN|nr:MAG: hypothetical protein AVDCRST_MAG36-505 [uncultured Nocardioidaceae bacterium]